MPEKLNSAALFAIGAGSIFLYAGIKGYSVPKTIQSIVQGKTPTTGQTATSLLTQNSVAPAPGSGGITSAGANQYNHASLITLWQQAGGSSATANNAACHAMQESSGNPKVTSSNPDGGTNVGLWQLDTPGGVGAGYSIAQLQNPLLNAQITVRATNNGTNWSQWATPGC